MKIWANFRPIPRLKLPCIKPVTLLQNVDGWLPDTCYSLFLSEQDCIAGGKSRGIVGVSRKGQQVLMVELALDNLEHNIEVVDMIKAKKLFVTFTYRAWQTGAHMTCPAAMYFTELPPFEGAEPVEFWTGA